VEQFSNIICQLLSLGRVAIIIGWHAESYNEERERLKLENVLFALVLFPLKSIAVEIVQLSPEVFLHLSQIAALAEDINHKHIKAETELEPLIKAEHLLGQIKVHKVATAFSGFAFLAVPANSKGICDGGAYVEEDNVSGAVAGSIPLLHASCHAPLDISLGTEDLAENEIASGIVLTAVGIMVFTKNLLRNQGNGILQGSCNGCSLCSVIPYIPLGVSIDINPFAAGDSGRALDESVYSFEFKISIGLFIIYTSFLGRIKAQEGEGVKIG